MSNLNSTCTLDTCSLDQSFYNYRPSLAINAALAGIYGAFLAIGLIQGIWFRTWTFLFAFTMGNGRMQTFHQLLIFIQLTKILTVEIAGYIGRILSHDNPFGMTPVNLSSLSEFKATVLKAATVSSPNSLAYPRPGLLRSRNLPLSLPFSDRLQLQHFPPPTHKLYPPLHRL
jgi:hypothetical protein